MTRVSRSAEVFWAFAIRANHRNLLQPVRQKEPLLVKFEMARLRKATVLEKVTNRSDRYFVGVSNERSESQQEGFKLLFVQAHDCCHSRFIFGCNRRANCRL